MDKYDVPQEKLVEVIQAAYSLSGPQGLGHLHFKSGGLSAEEAAAIAQPSIDADANNPHHKRIRLDYVHGRSCKFNIGYDADGWFIEGPCWYDHSEDDLLELVRRCGLACRPSQPKSAE